MEAKNESGMLPISAKKKKVVRWWVGISYPAVATVLMSVLGHTAFPQEQKHLSDTSCSSGGIGHQYAP